MRKLTNILGMATALVLSAAAGSASASYDDGRGYSSNPYRSGYYDNGNYNRNARTLRCESRDQRTVYCSVDTRGGVTLVRQESRNSCIRGRTWGANSRGIWVSRGCRGTFALNELRSRPGYAVDRGYRNGYRSNGRTVRCESRDSRTRYCSMDTRYGVALIRQRSDSPCIQGSTWGAVGGRVWVTRGCRADFATGDSRYGYNPGYDHRRY